MGEEAVDIKLCNSTDMVAERGPISTSGSSSPGGEQATLLKILEKMQDKIEQMEKKIDRTRYANIAGSMDFHIGI